MGQVNGYTAERMKEIEDNSVVNGEIDPVTGHLMLQRFNETEIDAGMITQNPLRDTTANLAAANPVVAVGRIAIATDSNPLVFAFGDGVTAWNSLPKFERKMSWTTYTPTVTSTGTAPNLGTTGTKNGRWYKSGPLTFFEMEFAWGGTGITQGTGNYIFGLPHAAIAQLNPYGLMGGTCKAQDISAGLFREFAPHYYISTAGLFLSAPAAYPTGADAVVGASAPWAWAAGDTLKVCGWFGNV